MEGNGKSRTHAAAAKLAKVLLGSLVLLVLVNPLVKVGLEELQLLGLLKQAGPVLLLEFLLAQLQLDVARGVVDLGVLGVDLGVELELEVEVALQGVRVALELERGGLEVQRVLVGGDIGGGDGQVDEVLLRVGVGGALGPEDWSWEIWLAAAAAAAAAILGNRGGGELEQMQTRTGLLRLRGALSSTLQAQSPSRAPAPMLALCRGETKGETHLRGSTL